jgi:hypothetical protein
MPMAVATAPTATPRGLRPRHRLRSHSLGRRPPLPGGLQPGVQDHRAADLPLSGRILSGIGHPQLVGATVGRSCGRPGRRRSGQAWHGTTCARWRRRGRRGASAAQRRCGRPRSRSQAAARHAPGGHRRCHESADGPRRSGRSASHGGSPAATAGGTTRRSNRGRRFKVRQAPPRWGCLRNRLLRIVRRSSESVVTWLVVSTRQACNRHCRRRPAVGVLQPVPVGVGAGVLRPAAPPGQRPSRRPARAEQPLAGDLLALPAQPHPLRRGHPHRNRNRALGRAA